MNKIISVWMLLVLGGGCLKAENIIKKPMYRNIYAEVFGPSGIVGINYEARFKPGSKFGWRAGASYDIRNNTPIFNYGSSSIQLKGVSFPIGSNFLIGRNKHKFEVGANLKLGIYGVNESQTVDSSDSEGNMIVKQLRANIGTAFNCTFSINVGYRYQRTNGILFRIGVAPDLVCIGKYPFYSLCSLLPYFSIGYTIQ